MRMSFGVASGRNDKIDDIADLAQVAEESGFSHLSFLDSQNLSRDIYVMMALVALNTRRIHTGQTVTNPFTRHPSVTANATATINELSGGRVFLGIGSGFSSVRTMGMGARPLAELRETIEFIKKYTAGQEAEYKGAKMHSEWVRQPLPIYVAAEGPKALELAGELADGVIFTGGPPFVIKWKVDHIEKGALRAGRDPSKVDVWVRSYIYVADSKEKAHRELANVLSPRAGLPRYRRDDPEVAALYQRMEREHPGILDEVKRVQAAMSEYVKPKGFDPWFERTDPPWAHLITQRMIDAVHLTGKPEDISEGIYGYAQVGVKCIATSVYTIIDKKGMLREIGDKVMPHFRN